LSHSTTMRRQRQAMPSAGKRPAQRINACAGIATALPAAMSQSVRAPGDRRRLRFRPGSKYRINSQRRTPQRGCVSSDVDMDERSPRCRCRLGGIL
jgi:hypothetical protein